MAKRPDVQYIRCYVDGSAARKLEPVAPIHAEKTIRMPAVSRQKRKAVYIDPVAILGILVAVCMLAMMLSGVAQLEQAQQEAAAMEQRLVELSRENDRLQQAYAAGYELSDIEQKALALGMVPASQVQQTVIYIPAPAEAEEPVSLWTQVGTFLSDIFA